MVETPKADEGNPNHVGAPMPGMVVRIAVQKGQSVTKGEPLLALEAMKMETVLAAPRDGRIKEIRCKPGTPVNARDLLIELE
jgi:pyruvate carboxylase